MPTRHPLDHPLVIFQPSRIHGIGGFAWVDLRKGQRIIEYIGPKISKVRARGAFDSMPCAASTQAKS